MNQTPDEDELAAVIAVLTGIAKPAVPAVPGPVSAWRKAARLESVAPYDDE